MVKKRGKQFFDCFARGVMVETPAYGPISFCRVLFFSWAMEIDLEYIIRVNWGAFQDFRKGHTYKKVKTNPCKDSPDAKGFSFLNFPSPVRYVVLFETLIPTLLTRKTAAPKLQAGCIT
jgi:hypothetical protein